MSKISKIAVPGVAEPYDIGTLSIPFGQVDSTSTDTAYTAQIEGITSLYDGVCVYLKNGVITSNKNGFTLNINSLGAKPVYDTLAAATRSGTVFNVDYTMLFVYNSSRVSGGCWDIFYGYNSDTTDLEEALTPLTGTTGTLTPMQVYNAIKSGKSVILQYMDDTYGLLSYTNFNVAESMNVIAANTIVYFNNTYVLAELWGDTTINVWSFMATTLAQKQDIPTKLPNPNALTFTGAVTGSYDGSEPVTLEIPSGGGGSGGSTAEWQLLGTYTMLVSDRSLVIDLSQFEGITHFRILGEFPKCTEDCGETYLYLGTSFNHQKQSSTIQNVYAFNLLAECELVDGQLYGFIGTIDGWNIQPRASVARNTPRDSTKITMFKIYYSKLVDDSTENTIQIWGY